VTVLLGDVIVVELKPLVFNAVWAIISGLPSLKFAVTTKPVKSSSSPI
jgi:hypothetical protein